MPKGDEKKTVNEEQQQKRKPLIAPGTGSWNPIEMMKGQYDDRYRTEKHKEILEKNKDSCPLKTAYEENTEARNFPEKGSKSRLGDAGIKFHQEMGKILDKLPEGCTTSTEKTEKKNASGVKR